MRRNFFKFVKDSHAPDEVGVIAVAILVTFVFVPWVEAKVGPIELERSSIPDFISPISLVALFLLFCPIFPGMKHENLADKEMAWRIEYLKRCFEEDEVTVYSAMDARGALNGGGSGFAVAVGEYKNYHIEAVAKDSQKFIKQMGIIKDIRRASGKIPSSAAPKDPLDPLLASHLKHLLANFPD